MRDQITPVKCLIGQEIGFFFSLGHSQKSFYDQEP
uniref:Uncharacterized protein n=1 Tax=Anguilla anguilla TaxID=7936 RepID=A0A0E9R9F1_ANGAN